MAVGENESVWRGLGKALAQDGAASSAGGAYPRLAGAHPVFYAVEQVGGPLAHHGQRGKLDPAGSAGRPGSPVPGPCGASCSGKS